MSDFVGFGFIRTQTCRCLLLLMICENLKFTRRDSLVLGAVTFADDRAGYPDSYFTEDVLEEGGNIENPLLIYRGRPRSVVIPCLPKGVNYTTKPETFRWKFVVAPVEVLGSYFSPDASTGDLKVPHPWTIFEGPLVCHAISSDESVEIFTHNILTLDTPYIMKSYRFYGVYHCRCDDDYLLYTEAPRMKDKLLQLANELYLDVRFEIAFHTSETTGECKDIDEQTPLPCCEVSLFVVNMHNAKYQSYHDTCDTAACARDAIIKTFENDEVVTGKIHPYLLGEYQRAIDIRRYWYTDIGRPYYTFSPFKFRVLFIAFCPEGYRPIQQAICFPCPPGTYGSSTTAAEEGYCAKCAEGQANVLFHQSQCGPCPAGSIINKEQTICIPLDMLKGRKIDNVDMERLLEISEDVDVELGKDKPWISEFFKTSLGTMREYKYYIIGAVLGTVVLTIIIGLCVWRWNKLKNQEYSPVNQNAPTDVRHMMFKAAAEVHKKKQIIDQMDEERRKRFQALPAEVQNRILEDIMAREKHIKQLMAMRNNQMMEPTGDPRVGPELPPPGYVGGVPVAGGQKSK